jgi:hypothetical protein
LRQRRVEDVGILAQRDVKGLRLGGLDGRRADGDNPGRERGKKLMTHD